MIPFRLIIFLFFLPLIITDCSPNYEYADATNTLCLPCQYNCQSCYDSTYCLQCMAEYYLSNNTCLKCSFGCSVCTSNSSCTTCNSGLYLTNSGSCSACGTGVATCTIAVIQSCQATYFLLATICAGCFANCNTCSDFVTCASCRLGYYLSSSSSSCLSCPNNCLICTSATECTACQQGFTQSNGLCTAFSCSSFDPFCIACTTSQCLTCSQGKYLNANNTCSQGGSLLCLQSIGPYHITCQTSSFGCPTYTYVQSDDSGNQLPVCLPKSATKTEEFIYIQSSAYSCSGSCSLPTTLQLSYTTTQAYYMLTYHLNIKFYGTVNTRQLTISFLNQNGTIAAKNTLSIDVSKEILAYSDIDSNCSCRYSKTIVSSSIMLSQGGYATILNITDSAGQFQVTQALFQHQICQVSFCSSCSSAIDCYACFSPYYLQLTTCVLSCDSGFYVYGFVCYLQCPVGSFTVSSTYSCSTCISPCLTCYDASTCLTCVTGYYLQGSACRLACSSTFLFANSTSGNCETCPNPCVTCSYANSTMKCLSCATGYLFNGSTCVFLCPWGEYGFFLNGTSACLNCSSSCSSCYINSTVCSSCTAGYLLLNTDCLGISSCPSSYFINSTYNQCVSCHYPCATCISSQTACTSCIRGSLLNNACWNQCPAGYYSSYVISQNITCSLCSSPCRYCISSTECISCVAGYYLYESTCISSCPVDYYAQLSNLTCVECIPPCKSCSNSTACLSCTTGYLDNTTCTLQCNSSAYINANFTCTLCPTPCLACYASNYCLNCQLPYFLYSHRCLTLAECTNITGYYPSYLPNATSPLYAECSSCAFPCFGCLNNSVTCTSCQSGYNYVPNLYKCLTSCPTTYYLTNSTCLICSTNCYQCNLTASNCTACSAGMYLDSATNSCLQACPSQYYPNDQTQSCSMCVSPCLSCYNLYLCSSCQTGILYQKQCISSCPSQTFLNATTNTCITCTSNCLTCINSSSLCLSCASGYFLLNQTCPSSCPSLYYSNQFTRVCQACSTPCGNCTSATSCVSCISGYYFFNTLCVTSCSSSYFADNATSQCLSCNLTLCLTCTGTANNCLTCNTNNGYYSYQQQCVSSCPNGTYADQVSGTCSSCPFPCSGCLNYTYCSSCLPSYLLFTNRCFSQCPIAYYADNSSVCQPCGATCQLCTSPTACLQCKSGYYILNGTCLTTCPLTFYAGLASITNYDSCLSCQANCLNCSSAQYCLVCVSGYMQFNGLCLSSCPILYYAVNQSNSYCSQCSQYCTSCINNTYCLTCIGSYLYQHACITQCPPQTYPYQGTTCNPCKPPCNNCTSDYTCLSCLSGYIYFHEYCVTSCPSDVWYYPNNNSCNTACPYNKYAQKMICYVGTCGTSMVSLNGYCLQQCSSDYYVNSNQECTLCSQNPSICKDIFTADLQILYIDVLTLVLYYSQKAALASISDISVGIVDVSGSIIPKNYSSYEITQYKVVIKYDYTGVSLVNITLNLPYLQSQETPQCLSTNQFKKELKSYKDYSSQSRLSFLSLLPTFLIGLLFIAIIVNMVNRASHFVQVLDFVQIVGVTLYLDVQYPPILEDFLSGFRLALFVINQNMINVLPYTFSPPKFIHYNVDTNVFRNSLPLLIIFLIILVFFVIVIAINAFNKERLVKPVRVIRYRLLNDLFSVCLTPLLLFSCQILHEKPIGIFITALLAAVGVAYVAWISYKIVQVRKLSELEGLLGEFQKTQSKLGLMYIPFGYVRRITLTLGLGIAPVSPISTLTLLLVTTFLIMICVYFYEPFDNHYTDYVTIFMECSLTLYVVFLVILALQSLSPSISFGLGTFVVALIALTFLICLSWLVYLTITDIRKKGCWPSLKQETNDEDAKDDYSDSKSQKNRKKQEKQREEERLRKLGYAIPLPEGAENIKQVNPNDPHPNEQSANDFLNRFQSRSDELFSNAINEQFKHWSDEQGSHKQSEDGKKEGLPALLFKKQIEKAYDGS